MAPEYGGFMIPVWFSLCRLDIFRQRGCCFFVIYQKLFVQHPNPSVASPVLPSVCAFYRYSTVGVLFVI